MKKTTNKIIALLKDNYNLNNYISVKEDKNSKSFYVLYKNKSIRFIHIRNNIFGAYVLGEIYTGEMTALLRILEEARDEK